MRANFLALKQDLTAIQRANSAEAAANPRMASTIVTHMNPPLKEEDVLSFESRHVVQLPPDYREFLLTIANGCVGPVGGLERLGQFNGKDWNAIPGLVGNLSTPFPYTDKWNTEPIDGSLPVEQQYKEQDRYWDKQHVHGAIPICDLGCGLRQLLIVSGAERGHIWFDDRADWQGLYPDSRGQQGRLSFFEWYRNWANAKLEAAT
ncbi:MAG TPA: SMI1/KNR4 family protein [Planctomycetaceae bacterium]|mgnify:CR=1 FL=1|nr:SMI1/KNR4 family protein [Planctomycetaceae bacterium]